MKLLKPIGAGPRVPAPAAPLQIAPQPVPQPIAPFAVAPAPGMQPPYITQTAPKPEGKGAKYNAGKSGETWKAMRTRRTFGIKTPKSLGGCNNTGQGEWNCNRVPNVTGENVYVTHGGTEEEFDSFHDAFRNDKATNVVETWLHLTNGERVPAYHITAMWERSPHRHLNVRNGTFYYRCIYRSAFGCIHAINEMIVKGPQPD